VEKRLIIYAAIIIICIVSIGLGIYAQFFADDKKPANNNDGTTNIQSSEKEQEAKDNFDNIFINTLVYTSDSFNNSAIRKDSTKDLVYTGNQTTKTVQGKYNMNINVPTLNIVSPVASSINKEIEDVFVKKATDIIVNAETATEYVIYSIDYAAYVNGNILSLVIKSTLKEGNKPQRIMYLAYNYNLQNATKITLDQYMNYKNIGAISLQAKINKEIKDVAKKYEELNSVGYSVFSRNPDDTMYKLENTTNYFLGKDNYLYIIYAYGNTNYTSEKDLILF